MAPPANPATKAKTGLVMKKEADPTTIPPAIGAWMTSRTITLPFIIAEMINEAIMDAPMPIAIDTGPLYKLNKLKLFVTSISYASTGNRVRMIRLPNMAYETLKGEAVLNVCFSVEEPSVLSSFNFKMKPIANPMKPPKVKMEYVPNPSTDKFAMTCLLS